MLMCSRMSMTVFPIHNTNALTMHIPINQNGYYHYCKNIIISQYDLHFIAKAVSLHVEISVKCADLT